MLQKKYFILPSLLLLLAVFTINCQDNSKVGSSEQSKRIELSQSDSKKFIFISDIQKYIPGENWLLKPYRNEEASDSLINHISRMKTNSVFLLGDLVAFGNSNNDWERVDKYIKFLHKSTDRIFAIPGNHEIYPFNNMKLLENFSKRFPVSNLNGFSALQDSVAIIMINSVEIGNQKQLEFYKNEIQKLDGDNSVKFIIVATHYPPYTNSTIVDADEEVQKYFVPLFIKSRKAKLFLSGHSHNLEYFVKEGKNFLVLGGGGGLKQPLKDMNERQWKDLLNDDDKPLYFYISIKRIGDTLEVDAIGFKKDFIFKSFPIMKISK
jgi:Icc-related predicted phosphoesterase